MSDRAACLTMAAALLALVGCTNELPPQRDCLGRVWVERAQGPTRVLGSWDDYRRPGVLPEPYDADWNVARLELPPGNYGYLLNAPGGLRRDTRNPLSTYWEQEQVSLMLIGDCSRPRIAIDAATAEGGILSVSATFLTADSEQPLEPDSVTAVTADGLELEVPVVNPADGKIVAQRHAIPRGKHTVHLRAADDDDVDAAAVASAWNPTRDWRDTVIYQVMIDRFRGDGGAPLPPPPHAGARAGGTLDGVLSSLDELAELGVNALWLSPVYRNPVEERAGVDGNMYEGYHGYWPERGREVEARIGGEQALEALVAEAHDRGVAVLLDVVPNHVYETHPRYLDHSSEDWFTPPGCVCGTDSCPWHLNIVSCWFTPYLPDIRWQNGAALEEAVAEVGWWVRRFDLDGVRIDAVPMMPRLVTRRIGHLLRRQVSPPSATLLLGEIFTGPGAGAVAHLDHHIGSSGLDSAFDFPLMWALREAIASGDGNFQSVEEVLAVEKQRLGNATQRLARILNNHDTSRFISVSQGDAFGDPWLQPAVQPTDAEPYRRLELALAVIFTLPGMPVLYQGDEVGLAGAGDPDCRRVMPAPGELAPEQQQLRSAVASMARLRSCSATLRRGTREPLAAGRYHYAFGRRHDEGSAIVLVSTSPSETIFEVEADGYEGSWIDAVSGEPVEVSGGLSVAMMPLSYRVLLPAGHACASVW